MTTDLAPDDPRHGTRTGYQRGCRCDRCTDAHRVRCAQWRQHVAPLPDGDPRHGTTNGYRNYGCRCGPCTDANSNAPRPTLTPGSPRHGTLTGYQYGCRCSACREAHRLAKRDYLARAREWARLAQEAAS